MLYINTHIWNLFPSKPDPIKLLEENMGSTLFDINCSNIFFFDPCLRVLKIKTKLNKWDLFKSKNFLAAKEMLNKTKRQASE